MNGERITKSGYTKLTLDLLASTFDTEVIEDAAFEGELDNGFLETYEVTRATIDTNGDILLMWNATYEKDEG